MSRTTVTVVRASNGGATYKRVFENGAFSETTIMSLTSDEEVGGGVKVRHASDEQITRHVDVLRRAAVHPSQGN